MAIYVIATCSIDQQRSGYSHCSNGFFKQQDLYRWSATHVLFHKKIMWTPSIGHHVPLGVHGPPVEKPWSTRLGEYSFNIALKKAVSAISFL